MSHPADPAALEHGKTITYKRHKCRCPQCTEAIRMYNRERRAIRKATTQPDGTIPDGRRITLKHGTAAMYTRGGCRLPCCADAYRESRRQWNSTRGLTPGGRPVTEQKPKAAAKAKRKIGPQGGNTGQPRVSQRPAVIALERKLPVAAPQRFESTPVDQCGEPTGRSTYCRKPFPCTIHNLEGEL